MAVNMSQSAKLYQERRIPQDRITRRGPGPRADLSNNLVHTLTMLPPLALPEALQEENNHPPDAGNTKPWPHADQEVL